MLDGIKRWFCARATAPPQEWKDVASWAAAQRYACRNVGDAGFVVDGRVDATPWRLEWGPSQRRYIEGQELRIRSELGLAAELQAALMNRRLQEQMEKDVYEQYVEGVQTRIDDRTPPEMRWLVMFPKLGSAEMGALKERFVALGSHKRWLQSWLDGALAAQLQGLSAEPERPIVLTVGRGRLTLRTALADAAVPPLQAWLSLFETALRAARRAAGALPAEPAEPAEPSRMSAAADEPPATGAPPDAQAGA